MVARAVRCVASNRNTAIRSTCRLCRRPSMRADTEDRERWTRGRPRDRMVRSLGRRINRRDFSNGAPFVQWIRQRDTLFGALTGAGRRPIIERDEFLEALRSGVPAGSRADVLVSAQHRTGQVGYGNVDVGGSNGLPGRQGTRRGTAGPRREVRRCRRRWKGSG